MRKLIIGILFLLLPIICFGQVVTSVVSYASGSGVSGFPQILTGTSTGADASVETTRAITMPTDVAVGDLILVLIACDGTDGTDLIINTGVSGVNWTVENRQQYGTQNVTAEVIWKIAEGSDALTITSTAEKVAYIAYRISNFKTSDPITVTNTTGVKTTNPDPPANTGVDGAVNYLWITWAITQNNPELVCSGAPTDFSGLVTQIATSASQQSVSSASREYNTAAAYDPGTFTCGDSWWLAYTIIVNPI